MRDGKTELKERLTDFHAGRAFCAYEFMGAHPAGDSAVFRVWAPNASDVSVVGDFNGWSPVADKMEKISHGVWECYIKNVQKFDCYKYRVVSADGNAVLKADPYAFHTQTRPGTASKFYPIDNTHQWGDSVWMKRREKQNIFTAPLNIYEVHAGSWRQYPDGNHFSYQKLADELIPYVKKMGYTHIEFMPLAEYPLDMSWGYQTTGYFSPSSRYGEPPELMEFVDRCHKAGVGVIMDWVGAHFPKDGYGLYQFDGDFCYEYADPRKRESPEWGTHYFDYGRNEVVSFLVSSVDYWINRYHFDGVRVDAVSAMLYLDYGRKEWAPNIHGGNHNLEAIALLQTLNGHILGAYPGTMMIAEESTSFPKVSHEIADGGLGFSFKWNMGWMNDTLSYMETDPYFRGGSHNKLTFSMMYAFSERFILPISHDEVVHGKKSLLDKMPGDYAQKFANTRLFMAYMTAHPGKKLMFMGCEYGPFREWDYASGLEWFMLDFEAHKKLQGYKAVLDEFYLKHPALWKDDNGWDGFQWIAADDSQNDVISFIRKDGNKQLVCVFNFAGNAHEGYRIGVPKAEQYREVLTTDDERFFGAGIHNGAVKVDDIPMHGFDHSIPLTLPPLSAVFLERDKI
ncbi:MAG TPA: 1,4-alpha-glucan branching protein GlgB [Oscillospiraceae bacterium]|nr:1,4-alpha-glucan branching protein GlgB [Oscillospiraceae bacterium]HPF56817.1 1,4-alpha-glucan branching protein GlgB [Clostridiales bacterium]HPK35397.1 1,4-alpha-glucan branching protein GlgB [Oscillospiraceae bacterium]HPR75310.1 1,4-alpha-glucan branching protein GlgB [Oscillospiraceae bacterium]